MHAFTYELILVLVSLPGGTETSVSPLSVSAPKLFKRDMTPLTTYTLKESCFLYAHNTATRASSRPYDAS